MGSSICCSSAGGEPTTAEQVMNVGNQERLDLEKLQGPWMDCYDDTPIGYFEKAEFHWNENLFETAPAPSPLQSRPNQNLCMLVQGTESLAVYEPDAPARLCWADGAVWIRDDLQGSWTHDSTGAPVCKIAGGQIDWDPDEDRKPSRLERVQLLPYTGATICISSSGEDVVHSVHFEPGPPSKVTFSSGDVWVRGNPPSTGRAFGSTRTPGRM
mmetsp:Transcript_52723/g.112805  ORF Transcript_52723/g.112805 Transcript_52723/m.112805 type:complete len:213 (-) Transcript_52723:16-654(-)